MARSVLVVDDEPLVLEVIGALLEELGCEVMTVSSATEALGKLAEHSEIEILITDINMPGMDGYELAERARRMRVGLEVLLISGHASEDHGFPLIRKPFFASGPRTHNETNRSLVTRDAAISTAFNCRGASVGSGQSLARDTSSLRLIGIFPKAQCLSSCYWASTAPRPRVAWRPS